MEPTADTSPNLRELGYLDASEAAELLNVTRQTLSNWRTHGEGPPFTKVHGNRIAYSLDSIRKYLKSKTVTPRTLSGRKARIT